MDMVTSFLRAFSLWVALVEKVPPLGSNASCDDPSSMASSGESRDHVICPTWSKRMSCSVVVYSFPAMIPTFSILRAVCAGLM